MSFPDDNIKENLERLTGVNDSNSQEDVTVLREVTNGSKGQNI